MSDDPGEAQWNVADWHDKMLIDRNGEKIGKLQDVYVDVETDVPQFATVKEGFVGRHLTFVPLGGIQIGPNDLQVAVTKVQVRSAPDIEMHGATYLSIRKAAADWPAAEVGQPCRHIDRLSHNAQTSLVAGVSPTPGRWRSVSTAALAEYTPDSIFLAIGIERLAVAVVGA
jgi:sporulation protein YlmC with PRC-barrel domain